MKKRVFEKRGPAGTAMALKAAVAGAVLLAVAGCASTSPDDSAGIAAADVGETTTNDPLEPLNRGIYGVNWYFDHTFLRPVAYAYRDGVPEPARERVSNTLDNLSAPVVLANDVLQGEWDRAWTTFMRFLINSTWGLAGIHDVAAEMGFEKHDEDFGQTLAVHGVDSGPYLVLPLFGPSNVRDGVGLAVDWLADPFRIYATSQNWHEVNYARGGLTAVDTQAGLLDVLEDIERTSLDPYAAIRSMYQQRRIVAIRNEENGGPVQQQDVDGSAFDFDAE